MPVLNIDATHRYYDLDHPDRVYISVTQLLRKHGLSPDLSGIPAETLEKKAEFGTMIHEELKNFAETGEIGFTREVSNVNEYLIAKGLKIAHSENIVANDIAAGTYDAILSDGTLIDYKTTYTLDKSSVQWQTSIYAYLSGMDIKGTQCFHFDKEGNLEVVDLPMIPKEEIDKLMECERRGEIYHQGEMIPTATVTDFLAVQDLIENLKKEEDAYNQKMASIKTAILQAMKDNNILAYETDRVKITYVSSYTRATIDSARLKKDLPEIADKYSKTSTVGESVKITVK